MKLYTFLCGLGALSLCLYGSQDMPLANYQHISWYRGVIDSSRDGDLVCSVIYNSKDDTYSGVLVNNQYETPFWTMKRIDNCQCFHYYQILKEKAEKKEIGHARSR